MAKEEQPSMFKPGTTEISTDLAAKLAEQRIRAQMEAQREKASADALRLQKAREEAEERKKQHSS